MLFLFSINAMAQGVDFASKRDLYTAKQRGSSSVLASDDIRLGISKNIFRDDAIGIATSILDTASFVTPIVKYKESILRYYNQLDHPEFLKYKQNLNPIVLNFSDGEVLLLQTFFSKIRLDDSKMSVEQQTQFVIEKELLDGINVSAGYIEGPQYMAFDISYYHFDSTVAYSYDKSNYILLIVPFNVLDSFHSCSISLKALMSKSYVYYYSDRIFRKLDL